MRRLFSSFARGRPGIGLLILRVAAGITLIVAGTAGLLPGPSLVLIILYALTIAGGIFLTLGLWTPIAGSLVAAIQLWAIVSHSGAICTNVLLAALGAGLALIGPGGFSIDARLFGWKRLNIR